MARVNFLAVIIATIIRWLLGALWYSPILFGNRFIELMKWTPEQVAEMQAKGTTKEITLALMTSFIQAYVLAQIINYANSRTILQGAIIGLLVWVGFVATVGIESVLFESRNQGLFQINTTYNLVGLILMGAIIAWLKGRKAAKAG